MSLEYDLFLCECDRDNITPAILPAAQCQKGSSTKKEMQYQTDWKKFVYLEPVLLNKWMTLAGKKSPDILWRCQPKSKQRTKQRTMAEGVNKTCGNRKKVLSQDYNSKGSKRPPLETREETTFILMDVFTTVYVAFFRCHYLSVRVYGKLWLLRWIWTESEDIHTLKYVYVHS